MTFCRPRSTLFRRSQITKDKTMPSPVARQPQLSKSRYQSGTQCDKRLYLEAHRRELLPETSASLQAVFDQGHEVGALACERHPGGVLIEADYRHFQEALAATEEAMEDSTIPAIFEAAFVHDNVKIRADIMIRNTDGTWDLHEVKSTGSLKDVHLPDVAVQVYVLRGCGVDLRQAGLLHLNKTYVLAEDGLDLAALFTFVDLLDDAHDLQPEVKSEVQRLHAVLQVGDVPVVEAGPHCNKPYACPFQYLCIEPADPFDISELPRSAKLVERMAALDIFDVRKLPPGTKLTPTQTRVANSLVTGTDYVGPELRATLEHIDFPLYFLDFETCMPAIPRYVGTRVYQTLPTQWSLHTLDESGILHHSEFLHREDSDPRLAFIESLLKAMGDEGTIVVYSSYERTQLNALAAAFPAYADRISALITRFQDLLKVITKHYYHPDFGGSYSIKTVLPALVPELDYGDLDISDGQAAATLYMTMVSLETTDPGREKIAEDLLRYCERDTYAMVAVRKALLARCR
jgi:hypothetical protein